jgi:hypothetical protein
VVVELCVHADDMNVSPQRSVSRENSAMSSREQSTTMPVVRVSDLYVIITHTIDFA